MPDDVARVIMMPLNAQTVEVDIPRACKGTPARQRCNLTSVGCCASENVALLTCSCRMWQPNGRSISGHFQRALLWICLLTLAACDAEAHICSHHTQRAYCRRTKRDLLLANRRKLQMEFQEVGKAGLFLGITSSAPY